MYSTYPAQLLVLKIVPMSSSVNCIPENRLKLTQRLTSAPFLAMNEEMVTLRYLADKMAEYNVEPCSTQWVKEKLLNRYGDNVIVASICGKADVIIDSTDVSKQIQGLYSGNSKMKSEDEQKKELVR